MSSIALFPCIPTLESEIVSELATILELKVYTDEDLFRETAARFGCDAGRLRKMMYGKTSVFNQFTLEKEKDTELFKRVIADKLCGPEQYLFYGFLSALIAPKVTEVLRVLVVDTKDRRVERGLQEGISEKDVKNTIHDQDVRAFGWTDFLHQAEAYDSSLYDLLVPVEDLSYQEIAKEIVGYFHKTSVLRSTGSQKAATNMLVVAEIRSLLLSRGHDLVVRAEGDSVTVLVKNSVLNFGGLSDELTELVDQVAGVREVTVEKCKMYTDSIYRQQKFELPSKVLFVDDERDFVQTVSQRLISRDVGTYGVYNGEEALELIAEDRPEVMVLDLKMPGLHGVEVLRRAKKVAPEIEVIILTGHGTTKDMEECMDLGAFAYLNKPVDIDELSLTIKAANDKVHGKSEK